jgi:hypothetical protein
MVSNRARIRIDQIFITDLGIAVPVPSTGQNCVPTEIRFPYLESGSVILDVVMNSVRMGSAFSIPVPYIDNFAMKVGSFRFSPYRVPYKIVLTYPQPALVSWSDIELSIFSDSIHDKL